MRYILINGAPGVGKGWLASQLKLTSGRYGRASFAEPIRKTVSQFFGIDLSTPELYSSFKEQTFYGLTGRQWMIHFGNMGRSVDANLWVDALIRGTKGSALNNLFLVDDWGFDNEYFRLLSTPGVECLTVYIGRDCDDESYGQFPGDSRYRCTAHCSIRAPNSSTALVKVRAALDRRGW